MVGVKSHLSAKVWHPLVPGVLTKQEITGLVPTGLQNKAQGMLIPAYCLARSAVSDTTAGNACVGKTSQAPFGVSLGMAEQAAGNLKLTRGGRDVLQVLLGEVAFSICWS